MEFVLSIIFTLLVVNIFNGRKLLQRIKIIPRSGDEPFDGLHFITHPDTKLTFEQKGSIAAFMKQHQIELLDLIAETIDPDLILDSIYFTQFSQDDSYRFSRGYSGGSALILSEKLHERLQEHLPQTASFIELNTIAARLKYFTPLTMESAMLFDLEGIKRTSYEDYLIHKDYFLDWQAIAFTFALLNGLSVLVATHYSIMAWFILAAYLLRTPLMLMRGPFKVKNILRYSLLCIPFDIYRSLKILYYSAQESLHPSEEYLKQKSLYDLEFRDGTDRFFHPKRIACPLCQSPSLKTFLKSGDTIQRKPGKFILVRCKNCGFIFQNPQLNIVGLNLYYQDFYSGIDQSRTELSFKLALPTLRSRLDSVLKYNPCPDNWLDVGMGHGHFCHIARTSLSGCRFEGIDLNSQVTDAQKWGWIDQGYIGLFPELADQITKKYDVVSMGHYIEHTVDPSAEIVAARKVLTPQGLLMIEVPNPDSLLSRLLGSLAMPWMQPQHLNFLCEQNFRSLLCENGFHILKIDYAAPDMPVDFYFFLLLFMRKIAPPHQYPWLKRSLLRILWCYLIALLLSPLFICGLALDHIRINLLKGRRFSNSLRIVAQKIEVP